MSNIYSKRGTIEYKGRGRSTDFVKSRQSFKFSKSITKEKKKELDYKVFNQKFKERVVRDKIKKLPIPRRRSLSKKSKSKDESVERSKRGVFESLKSDDLSEPSLISDIGKKERKNSETKFPRKMSQKSATTNVKGKIRTLMMRSLSRKYKKVIKDTLKARSPREDNEKLTEIVKDLKKENLIIYRKNEEMKKELVRVKDENRRIRLEGSEHQKDHLMQIKQEKQKVFNLLQEKEEMTGIIEELINEITILKDEMKLMSQAESMNDAINNMKNAARMGGFNGNYPDWNKSVFKSCDLNSLRYNRERDLDIMPFLHSIKEEDQEAEDYNSENTDQLNAGVSKPEAEVLTESKIMRRFNSKENIQKIVETNDVKQRLKETQETVESLKMRNEKLEREKGVLETNLKLLRGKYMQSLMSLRLEKVQVQELKRQIQLSSTSTFMESVLENGKSMFNFDNEEKKSRRGGNDEDVRKYPKNFN